MNNVFVPTTAYNGTNTFTNQTIRLVVHTSIGGGAVRIRLSNAFGSQAISISATHLALRDSGANIIAGSDRVLTFGGQPTVSIPGAADVLSDPICLSVPAAGDLAVSLYFAGTVTADTTHGLHRQTNYASPPNGGDASGAITFPLDSNTPTFTQWPLLTGVEVYVPATTVQLTAFGDSITDGDQFTPDTNHRWPDRLAARLLANGQQVGVVNAGIAAGRVLNDQAGPNGESRFERDVLVSGNVKWVTDLLGTNDIGLTDTAFPTQSVGADKIIAGKRQFIARAHELGLKIYGCTLLPFGSSSFGSATGEAKRQAVNAWVRPSGEYDAVIDFDAVIKDPANPANISPTYNSGDWLHPNDAGYQAMANAIDLTLFNGFVTLNSVVSRKTHGAGAGVYDLPLPQGLCTRPGIESRGGGASGGDYSLVFSFAAPITSVLGAAVAEGVGSVASLRVNPDDPSQALVTLTGVSSGQHVTVGLTNVTDALGNTSSVRAVMGVLVGDAGGDGSVNAADIAQTRSLSGQGVTAANFRADLNLDGVINAADIAFVKSRSGTALPSPAPSTASSNP